MGTCRKCGLPRDDLDSTGLCPECAWEALEADVGDLQEPVTDLERQIIYPILEAQDPGDIGGILAKYSPPAVGEVELQVIREKLIRALKGKVSSPAKMVDAWLRRAQEQDAGALTARAADALVQLAMEQGELWHTRDGEGFATVEVSGHKEHHRIKSRKFRHWMTGLYFDYIRSRKEKTAGDEISFLGALIGGMDKIPAVPPAQAIADARHALEALAVHQGQEFEPHVRVAGVGNLIYIDLADDDWQAIEVSPTGWKVVPQAPVKFIRPEGMLAVPVPTEGGSLEDLKPLLNVAEDDWPLVAGFLVGTFRPTGPYPVLNLLGEQGAAKSTAARIIRSIVDPGKPPHRSRPRNEHDLVINAARSWVLSFDNISTLPAWLSDALCRLSTGGGFGTRMLYSDDEERLFDSERPQILNGIEDLATRGDLLDRSILVTLPVLEDEDRREEEDLDRDFERACPGILGALLDAVSAALRRLPEVKLDQLPRMADFAKWVVAAEEALGLEEGAFMAAYTGNRAEANRIALEADRVASEMLAFMEGREEWEGTASELLEALELRVGEKAAREKAWPKTPHGLSGKLRRLAPNLRRAGLGVEFDRDRDARSVKISRYATERHKRHKRQTSGNAGEAAQDRDAGDAQNDGEALPRDARDARDAGLHTSNLGADPESQSVNGLRERAWEALREHGPQSVPALGKLLDVAWGKLPPVLKELVDAGLVRTYEEGGIEMWEATEEEAG